MRLLLKWFPVVGFLAIAIAAPIVYHKAFRWKRFEVVTPGVLCRSGALQEWQLRQAIREHGFKTVFSFTHTNNDMERRVCKEEGVQRYFCYLHGDGVGPSDPYLRFLQIMEDPANHPVLVHCSAGVQRTGGAVALYRTVFEGWSIDEAIREMIDKGNDGKPELIAQLRRIDEELRPQRLATDRSPSTR